MPVVPCWGPEIREENPQESPDEADRCGCPPGAGLRNKPGGSIAYLAGSIGQSVSPSPEREKAVTEKFAGQSCATLRELHGQGEGLCVPRICLWTMKSQRPRNQSLDGQCFLSLFLVQIYLVDLHMRPPSWQCPSRLLPAPILWFPGFVFSRHSKAQKSPT